MQNLNHLFRSATVSTLLAVTIVLVSCRNPNDVSKDLLTSISSEANSFAALQLAESQIGEGVTSALNQWLSSLQKLTSYTSELEGMVSKAKPEELKEYQSKIEALREPLNNVLSRSATVKLKVPAWNYESLLRSIQPVGSQLQKLSADYTSIYGQVPNQPQINVTIEKDDRLYDTYGDCVGLFSHRSDPNCRLGAVDYCTHQTDLECVKRVIKDHETFGMLNCSDSMTNNQTGETYYYVAGWIKTGLRACISSRPILRQ